MLSSKDGLFDRARGRMVGSDQYLTKPFTKESLISAVASFAGLNGKLASGTTIPVKKVLVVDDSPTERHARCRKSCVAPGMRSILVIVAKRP